MGRACVREGDRVERQAAADEPARHAVQQAQQPFVGEHARRGVEPGAEAAAVVQQQLGARAVHPQLDAEGGQHDAQEADRAQQGLAQRGRAEQCAAEELEAARAHRLREQAEGLVFKCLHAQVVEQGVALDRDARVGFCKVDPGACEQRRRIESAPLQPGQHAGDEAGRDRGAAAAGDRGSGKAGSRQGGLLAWVEGSSRRCAEASRRCAVQARHTLRFPHPVPAVVIVRGSAAIATCVAPTGKRQPASRRARHRLLDLADFARSSSASAMAKA